MLVVISFAHFYLNIPAERIFKVPLPLRLVVNSAKRARAEGLCSWFSDQNLVLHNIWQFWSMVTDIRENPAHFSDEVRNLQNRCFKIFQCSWSAIAMASVFSERASKKQKKMRG